MTQDEFNEFLEDEDVSETPEPILFNVHFLDGKVSQVNGFLAVTPEVVAIADSDRRIVFQAHQSVVHHVEAVKQPVLSVVKN